MNTDQRRIILKDSTWHEAKQPPSGLQPAQNAPPSALHAQPVRIPAQTQNKPIGDYLAAGWQRYGVARNTFASVTGYYAYEQQYNVCALAAIYIAATGASFDDARHVGFDAVEYGITRVTGINLRHIYAPAVMSTEYAPKGQLVSLFSHLYQLTDNGWPKDEIIHYCYAAQAWHNQNNRR